MSGDVIGATDGQRLIISASALDRIVRLQWAVHPNNPDRLVCDNCGRPVRPARVADVRDCPDLAGSWIHDVDDPRFACPVPDRQHGWDAVVAGTLRLDDWARRNP